MMKAIIMIIKNYLKLRSFDYKITKKKKRKYKHTAAAAAAPIAALFKIK